MIRENRADQGSSWSHPMLLGERVKKDLAFAERLLDSGTNTRHTQHCLIGPRRYIPEPP